MSRVAPASRSWRLPRPLLRDSLRFTSLAWIGTLVTMLGVTLAFAYFSHVPGSLWGFVSQPARWYLAIVTGYLVYTMLPLYVTHGRTRRDAATELLIVLLANAGLAALLVTVGYLLESGLYGIGGWAQTLPDQGGLVSLGTLPRISAEHTLVFLVWTGVGAFVGAAFYRFKENGWPSLLVATVLLLLASVAGGDSLGPFSRPFEWLVAEGMPLLGLSAAVSLACLLSTVWLAWRVVRNVPIHNR